MFLEPETHHDLELERPNTPIDVSKLKIIATGYFFTTGTKD